MCTMSPHEARWRTALIETQGLARLRSRRFSFRVCEKIECAIKHQQLCGVCYKTGPGTDANGMNLCNPETEGGARACRNDSLKKKHSKKRCVLKTLLVSAFHNICSAINFARAFHSENQSRCVPSKDGIKNITHIVCTKKNLEQLQRKENEHQKNMTFPKKKKQCRDYLENETDRKQTYQGLKHAEN